MKCPWKVTSWVFHRPWKIAFLHSSYQSVNSQPMRNRWFFPYCCQNLVRWTIHGYFIVPDFLYCHENPDFLYCHENLVWCTIHRYFIAHLWNTFHLWNTLHVQVKWYSWNRCAYDVAGFTSWSLILGLQVLTSELSVQAWKLQASNKFLWVWS